MSTTIFTVSKINFVSLSVEIFVEYPDFVKLELLNGYNGKDPRWNLPDLAYEGEAWALFKLSIAIISYATSS